MISCRSRILAKSLFGPAASRLSKLRLSSSTKSRRLAGKDLVKLMRERVSRDRDFSMSYPSQRWPLDLSGFGVNGNGKGEGGLTVSFVSEEEEKDFVKKYMLDTFYRTAPVPRTIGLTETLEQGQPFLDEEIDSMLESGLCQLVRDGGEGGEVLGAAIHCGWERDPDYCIVDTTPAEWFSAANTVASEVGKSRAERLVAWRDLQFWFSYNLGQRLCVSQGRRRALYACNGFVEPRHRHRNVSSYWMRELRRVAGAHDAALFTCFTFTMSEKFLRATDDVFFRPMEGAAVYDDMAPLDLDGDGGNVWRPLFGTGGISFLEGKP